MTTTRRRRLRADHLRVDAAVPDDAGTWALFGTVVA